MRRLSSLLPKRSHDLHLVSKEVQRGHRQGGYEEEVHNEDILLILTP
jgi:hypothetical protein